MSLAKDLRGRLKAVAFEKERVALALLSLAFFGIVYLLVASNAPPDWGRAFVALALCYLTGFMALASAWFWARWFASGLGWSGLMVGIVGLITLGWHPTLATYAGLHGIIVVTLLGPRIASLYDQQPAWRQRFAMDEFGVARLRRAVTRAAASLPSLIVWALGPRERPGTAAALLLALLALSGLHGLLRLRAWSLVALGGAGLALVATGVWMSSFEVAAPPGQGGPVAGTAVAWASALASAPPLLAVVTGALLVAAVLPLVKPAVRFLRSLPR
jgi:hypothetical protein